jgi:hypothetical protein
MDEAAQPGGWLDPAVPLRKALREIRALHEERSGWCYVCGGKYPCRTAKLATEGLDAQIA